MCDNFVENCVQDGSADEAMLGEGTSEVLVNIHTAQENPDATASPATGIIEAAQKKVTVVVEQLKVIAYYTFVLRSFVTLKIVVQTYCLIFIARVLKVIHNLINLILWKELLTMVQVWMFYTARYLRI